MKHYAPNPLLVKKDVLFYNTRVSLSLKLLAIDTTHHPLSADLIWTHLVISW